MIRRRPRFRELPLRPKLTLAIAGTSTLVVLLALASLIVWNAVTYRSSLVRQVSSMADLVGNGSVGALLFADPEAAREELAVFQTEPSVVAAELFTASGRRLAGYGEGSAHRDTTAAAVGGGGHGFSRNRLDVHRPVVFDGDTVGSIHVRADLRGLQGRILSLALGAALVLLVSVLLSVAVSTALRDAIAGPVLRLAELARSVSETGDYGLRMNGVGGDEVGRLSTAFNSMLARIESQSRRLHRHLEAEREARDALSRTQRQLQESQKMEAVGSLAAGVAHDFNNLLTVIGGNSAVALGDLPPAHPARDALEEIATASDSAASLTRQLLAFSRKQVLHPESLDLRVLVGDLANVLRRLIGEHIRLRIDTDVHPAVVRVDRGQIQQVVLNLAVNARDAMPGGGDLTLRVGRVGAASPEGPGSPDDRIVLGVTDTGTGMDEEVRSRIFEPFFTTKEQGRGTGLGLSTVYGIVRQSGGQITVESEPGRGTTFRILLPAVASPPAEPPPPMAPTEGEARGRRVLVVEDAAGVRNLARRVLEGRGYEVLSAADGEAALRLVVEHGKPVHLLLTDVVMPGMSGPEVAEALQDLWPGVPVLFMSGYSDDAIVHHGVLLDGVELLEKPFTPETLLAEVGRILDGTARSAAVGAG